MLPKPDDPRAVSRRQALSLDLGRSGPELDTPVADYWIRVRRQAMACRFEVVLSGEDGAHLPAARAALDLVEDLEAQLTVFRDTSEVVRLNRRAARASCATSASMFALLEQCSQLHASTEGAFDVTSTPLSRCWGFLRREGRLPSEQELADARARVGMQGVELDAELCRVRFQREGMELNFGAIGKGHALDKMALALRSHGVRNALLSAGHSSVLALGGPDEGYLIDLVSPRARGPRLARLRLQNAALGTSGAGVQFALVDGQRYGHVLDPRTGRPAAGVLSASVVASQAAAADALSTAFLIGGIALARRYCETHPDVLALITPDDGSETPVRVGDHPGARLEESC
jgi:thiamine biosynthesis lipoprotein